jgi:hypothetical protein
MASRRKNGPTWYAVFVSSTNLFARLPLIMTCPMRQSGVFWGLLTRKAQDKPLSFPLPVFEDAYVRCDHSCPNAVHHLFLSRARSESPTHSSASPIRSRLASGAPSLASSSRTVYLSRTMPAMLSRRHSNSVAEEGGRNTGRTWTRDGKRRQVEALWFPIPGTPVCPAQSTELRWLRGGESAWVVQEKSMPLPHPRADRCTSALSIGCPCP